MRKKIITAVLAAVTVATVSVGIGKKIKCNSCK